MLNCFCKLTYKVSNGPGPKGSKSLSFEPWMNTNKFLSSIDRDVLV